MAFGLCAGIGTTSDAAASSEARVFTIAKSENRNVVQYSVHVDAGCVPTPEAPVYAYWRMLEQGPASAAPLLKHEVKAYGLSSQRLVPPVTPGAAGAVRVVLAAVPSRPVLVETLRAPDGTCRAQATVQIAGAPAHLTEVYVRLKSAFGVDYLLLRGRSMDGGRPVEEKLGHRPKRRTARAMTCPRLRLHQAERTPGQ